MYIGYILKELTNFKKNIYLSIHISQSINNENLMTQLQGSRSYVGQGHNTVKVKCNMSYKRSVKN